MLEALTRGGVETILFVEPPTGEQLAQYPQVGAVGVAGTGRTMSPTEMDATLPGVFTALGRLGPKFVHYKVCSTFDSSPRIGSIGRAIDIGSRVFQNRLVPLVVGAPVLQRFCVFANLFARSGLDSPAYRLDRHPTMREHPVTPMTEADLRLHLGRQTELRIGLVDVLALEDGYDAANTALQQELDSGANIVLFDTASDSHLATIGRLLAEAQQRENRPLFVAGSSGVEYALAKHLEREATDANASPVAAVDRAFVVSGSRSPVTARQVAWAVENGYVDAPLQKDASVSDTVNQVRRALESGRSAIVSTGRGQLDGGDCLGQALGRILREVLHSCRVPRVAVVGGDTAGQVAQAVGIEALDYIGPLEPGSPLCRARSSDPAVDGLEITFKGGQVGHDDFFATLLRGRRER